MIYIYKTETLDFLEGVLVLISAYLGMRCVDDTMRHGRHTVHGDPSGNAFDIYSVTLRRPDHILCPIVTT